MNRVSQKVYVVCLKLVKPRCPLVVCMKVRPVLFKVVKSNKVRPDCHKWRRGASIHSRNMLILILFCLSCSLNQSKGLWLNSFLWWLFNPGFNAPNYVNFKPRSVSKEVYQTGKEFSYPCEEAIDSIFCDNKNGLLWKENPPLWARFEFEDPETFNTSHPERSG